MSTTAILLLVVGVETALVVGSIIGVVVGVRLDATVNSYADDARAVGVAEGRLAASELALARVQGRVEATEHLQRLTKTALTDVSRAGRRAAS